MATNARDITQKLSTFNTARSNQSKRINIVRTLIKKPVYAHRKKLHRGWFYPRDWKDAYDIAKKACKDGGLENIDELTLYLEANKMASKAARDLFPNTH